MEKRFKNTIETFRTEGNPESLMEVLKTVSDMMTEQIQIVTPVDVNGVAENEEIRPENISLMHIQDGEGKCYLVAFTSMDEHKKGLETNALFMPLGELVETCMEQDDIEGIVFNPWTDSFMFKNELIGIVNDMIDQKKVRATSLEEDFYLHVIDEKPIDLYLAVRNRMPEFDAVNRVYITGLNNKGKECYLLIIDFEGEEIGNLFARILETLPVPRDGRRIELTPYTGQVPDGVIELIYEK